MIPDLSLMLPHTHDCMCTHTHSNMPMHACTTHTWTVEKKRKTIRTSPKLLAHGWDSMDTDSGTDRKVWVIHLGRRLACSLTSLDPLLAFICPALVLEANTSVACSSRVTRRLCGHKVPPTGNARWREGVAYITPSCHHVYEEPYGVDSGFLTKLHFLRTPGPSALPFVGVTRLSSQWRLKRST